MGFYVETLGNKCSSSSGMANPEFVSLASTAGHAHLPLLGESNLQQEKNTQISKDSYSKRRGRREREEEKMQ